MNPRKQAVRDLLDEFLAAIKQSDKTPIVPAPNRWFAKPEEFPHVQPMVEKALAASGKTRDDFLHGAFLDPRTGQDLTGRMMSDVGVLIDPRTGRPMMSGRESGMEEFAELEKRLGNQTMSNLVRRSKFKPTGGDMLLNDIPFIATVEQGPHYYGLGTEYASPTQLFQVQTGSNPHLRPKSRGDVFGVGEVVGRMQIGRGPEHDVYEKLFVAPRGSDVPGKKLSKAEGGEVHAAGGGLKQAVRGKIDEFLAELNKPAKAAVEAAPQGEMLKVVEQTVGAPAITSAFGIKKGSGWSGTKTPDINKLAKKANKFIYHSDVAPNVNDLHYGIEPQQGGSWVKEIAHGTGVDDVDEFLESTTPLAWFSDTPSWVKMKVSRHLNKPLTEVTEDDIRNYGHLAIINKKDPGLENIWRVGEQGLSEGPYSKVQTIKGEEIPAHRTDLYQEDYRGNKEPFGVERNEWISTQPVEPFVQLTGDALIEFLKKSGNFKEGGEVHMADGGDPMLADLIERYKPTVKKPEPMTARKRLRDELESLLSGSMSPQAVQKISQTAVGGDKSILPIGIGVADFVPFLGSGMGVEEAARDLPQVYEDLKNKKYLDAAIGAGFDVLGLLPGAAGTAAVGRAAFRKARPIGEVRMAGAGSATKEAVKQGVKTAVDTVDDFIKKLYGNKPTGEVNYVTAQEGPFYRVSPSGAGEGQASRTGIREVTGTGEGVGSGGTGAVRGKVAKRYSPEEVARLVRENNIARRAAQKFGGSESALANMPATSLAKQGAIGRAFMEGATDNPQYKQAVYEAYGRQMPELMEKIGARDYDDLMDKAYRQLNYETGQQFNQMPVNMSFHRAGEGDYRSSREMLEDVHGNQHLYVFQGGEPHNMMSEVDPRTGLNQTEQFRAVHDLFGHGVYGNEFGPKGEELAFGAHSQMYSPLARIALATETRGQNSVVNYTPLNVELKAELAKLDALRYEAMRRGDEGLANEIAQQKRALYGENFQYSPNRGLLLPPEFTDPMYEGGLPEYMSGIFRPSQGASERLTHFSHDPSLTMTDPSRYGTGIRGEELYRLQGSKAPVMDRTYFYRGDNPRPETGLGRYRYGTQGEDLYSMASDPERLGLLAREANRMPFAARSNQGLVNEDQALTDFERLAKEYGYEGLLGDRAAIMYNPVAVERYADGGEVYMAPGGNPAKQRVKQVIKEGAQAIDDFLNSLKTRGAERVSPNYTNTALSDQQQRLADQIAQANPKLATEDVQKKALQQAQKKLEWERTEKPGLVKSYGALMPTSYSENKLKKMRNIPSVVQNRIDEANRFLDQPTEAWTPPPPEFQAFDRSSIKDALAGFPGVQQSTFPRDVPSRSSTSYVEGLYEDPQNRELIKKQIMRGLPLGGETFYASLYPVKQATLEAGMAPDAFEKWIHSLAPASARNSIMNEMAVGQFLRDLHAKGIPLTEANVERAKEQFKNTYGMGLPLMPSHRQGVADVLEGGRNLRDISLANIPTNYKIPTYGTQKAGDFGGSVVLDTHEAAGQTLGSRYHPYFNEQGGFSNAEYHPGEQGMLGIARELGGLPGGMAQAGRWFGGGELTGLISPRGDALDLLEKQMAYTLHNQGRQANPANIRKEVLDQIRTGEGLILPWWNRGGMPDYRTTGLQRKEGGDVSLDEFLANLESTH